VSKAREARGGGEGRGGDKRRGDEHDGPIKARRERLGRPCRGLRAAASGSVRPPTRAAPATPWPQEAWSWFAPTALAAPRLRHRPRRHHRCRRRRQGQAVRDVVSLTASTFKGQCEGVERQRVKLREGVIVRTCPLPPPPSPHPPPPPPPPSAAPLCQPPPPLPPLLPPPSTGLPAAGVVGAECNLKASAEGSSGINRLVSGDQSFVWCTV